MSYSISKARDSRLGALATLTFLAGFTIALVGLRTHPVEPVNSPRAPAVRFFSAAPAAPSRFEKELAMSPAALMQRWDGEIAQASRRFHVPAAWIRAVMRQESGGRTVLEGDMPITSSTGAMGLMQVMPRTYDEMRAQYGLGADPYDPHDNVLAGTAYLEWLHRKYGYPAMFAAYNDGPGNIDQYRLGKHSLPAETIAYLAHVTGKAEHLTQASPRTARLTRPDGMTVAIDGAAVKSVRAVLPGEYPPTAQSVLQVGKGRQAVREDVAAVTASLRRAGVRL